MNRQHFLHKAEECICVDREEQYGNPEDSFGMISKLWSIYLDREISPEDVGRNDGVVKDCSHSRGKV